MSLEPREGDEGYWVRDLTCGFTVGTMTICFEPGNLLKSRSRVKKNLSVSRWP